MRAECEQIGVKDMSFFDKLKITKEKSKLKSASAAIPIQEKREPKKEWPEPEGQLAVDVFETEESLIIQSTIAGVKAEDLDISIEGDVVTVRGKRERPEGDQQKNYFYQECYWGSFSRQVILPEEVDASEAEATLREGIFTLKIPKLKREQKRKIKVKEEG